MAPNLPVEFTDEIRMEVISGELYSDEEIWTYARKTIQRINPLLQGDALVADGTSVWDYTISGSSQVNDPDFWEIVKWGTIHLMLKHYMHKMIAEGIGASVGLGSERIDTKSLLLTVKSLVKDASNTLREKILAYNLTNVDGSVVDLYISEKVW
jgi:hypothetical protein